MTDYNERIKAIMDRQNMTVNDLASIIDCSILRANMLVNNRAKWKLDEIIYFADKFDISIDELFNVRKPEIRCSHKGCLSQRLKYVREHSGKNSEVIYNELGLRGTLYNWEHDKSEPRVGNLAKYANYLGFSIDDILGRTEYAKE